LCFSHIDPSTKNAKLTVTDSKWPGGGIARLIRHSYLKDSKKNTETIKILFVI